MRTPCPKDRRSHFVGTHHKSLEPHRASTHQSDCTNCRMQTSVWFCGTTSGRHKRDLFSECLHWLKTARPKVDANDICLCSKCSSNNAAQESRQQPVPTTNHTDNVLNVPAILQQVPLWQQQIQPQQLIMPIYWFPPPPLHSIPTFCCEIYKQHCLQSDKRGRPPHDERCVHRKKANRLVAWDS